MEVPYWFKAVFFLAHHFENFHHVSLREVKKDHFGLKCMNLRGEMTSHQSNSSLFDIFDSLLTDISLNVIRNVSQELPVLLDHNWI